MSKISDCIDEIVGNENDEKMIEERNKKDVIFIVFWCLIYLGMLAIQAIFSFQIIQAVVAQLQIVVSVVLTARYYKTGYLLAITLNMLSIICVILNGLALGNLLFVGVIIPLGTIVSVSFLFGIIRKLHKAMKESDAQREELVKLAEEAEEAYEEVRKMNEQLLETSRVIKENEERLNHMALFDALTELPNRRMIINRLDFHISYSAKTGKKFAVVFIDLDNFKRINDTLGHEKGDMVIKKIAQRITAALDTDDILGRLGGDEFAILVQRDIDSNEVLNYVEEIRTAISEPIIINNEEVTVNASFGASAYPKDGSDSTELLKCADMALYKAKADGKNRLEFFTPEMKAEIQHKVDFEASLVAGLNKEEFHLMFQPQHEPDGKKLRGFEALVRWRSEELGLVSPMQFIPMAEETGLIVELGTWIFKEACRKLRMAMDTYGLDNLVLSVNISTIQLMQPDFYNIVKGIMEETGVYGRNLEIEITESVFIKSVDNAVEVLNKIKKLGISIALDDFGTGYSSLHYLRSLPIDTLKIDKSFVDGINRAESEKEIVGSIISLAHNMNLFVVAEGVEVEEQLSYLRDSGCDCVQGYLLGRPLDDEQFNETLKKASEYLKTSESPEYK